MKLNGECTSQKLNATRRLEIQMIMLWKIEVYNGRNVPC